LASVKVKHPAAEMTLSGAGFHLGEVRLPGASPGATIETVGDWGPGVVSSSAERAPEWRPAPGHVPAEELARRQGVRPIVSVDELARPDLFESDEELDEFLVDLYASRRDGSA